MLETLETLKSLAQWSSLTLLGGFCLAVSAVIGWKLLERHGRILLQLRWASRVVAVALVVVCVMRGATKETNSPPAGLMGPPMGMVAQGGFGETDNLPTNGWREVSRSTNVLPASTFAMPSHGREWEEALARGARRGYWRVANDGWSFSNANLGWTNGFMWAEGQFRPRVESKLDGVQVFDHHFALAPSANWARYGLDASMCWCATNSVGGLIGTYVGAAIDDDPAKIVNAQFELFPSNGMLALRYDLSRAGEGPFMVGPLENGTNYLSAISSNISEVVFQRVHPDDWDMDGLPNGIDDDPRVARTNAGWNQSAEWAARSFPSNATEIAAAGGYLAWATARGAQPNRHLIGLEISSPSNIWPICLTFGDKQVMCNGKEEILFAIDDGARYAFSLSAGALASVTTHSPAVGHSSCLVWEYPGDSWAYDLLVHLDSPSSGWVGKVAEVMVDDSELTHFYPNDSKRITAVVTNCHEHAYIGCEWHHGGDVTFSDPHSLSTDLTWEGDEVWATNYVELVTRYEGGYAITNTYGFTVGVTDIPPPRISMSGQDVYFLNDYNQGNRTERVYRVSFDFQGAHSTTGSLSVASTGSAEMKLFLDETLLQPATNAIPIVVPEDGYFAATNLYLACPQLGRGCVNASCSLDGGVVVSTSRVCRIIEPLRRFVTNERHGDNAHGQLYNPPCLVYGTNAVLKVAVNTGAGAPFDPSEVKWMVVSGSDLCTFETNGLYATVTPVATSGVVVVEARFNDDSIQPRFRLPIVQPREFIVNAYIVKPVSCEECEVGGSNVQEQSWTEDGLMVRIAEANVIFSQCGIRFRIQDIVIVNDRPFDWEMNIETVVETANGPRPTLSDQAKALMTLHPSNSCIAVYCVGEIFPNKYKGAKTDFGILLPVNSSTNVLAHELGHVLGLGDCFSRTVADELMEFGDLPVQRGRFNTDGNDWGDEMGRGFYSIGDDAETILESMLMFGADKEGKDIPSEWVKALRENEVLEERTFEIEVGERYIERDVKKVYSK